MAATGFTPISLYYTTTAAAVPVNTNLVNGELAINITDGKLYYKDNAGVVKLLASNATVAPVTTFSAGTTGFTPSSATSGAVTLAGTLNVANGGTGLTSLTATYIPYGNGTSAFASSSGLVYNGSTFAVGGLAGSGSTVEIVRAATYNNEGAANIYLRNVTGTGGTGLLLGTDNTNNAAYIQSISPGASFSKNLAINAAGGQVGIGTLTPNANAKLEVLGNVLFRTQNAANTNTDVRILSGAYTGNPMTMFVGNGTSGANEIDYGGNTGAGEPATLHVWFTGTAGTVGGGTEKMRMIQSGQLLLNATTGTALNTIGSSATYPALKVPNIVEAANIVAGAPAATQTFYLNNGAVQYYTSNAANNWTINIAFSSSTTMNTAMAVGDSMSLTMITTQGSTAYYNSAVQIDGTTSGVTTKWQGSAPTSGNASAIDVYTYVVIKTAASTYTVLASQTKFA